MEELSRFGSVLDIVLLRNKSYCFVKCLNTTHAVAIYEGVHGKSPLAQHAGALYLSFCENGKCVRRVHNRQTFQYQFAIAVPSTNNSNFQVPPSGLIILEDFVTADEEAELLAAIDWGEHIAEDDNSQTLKHRQVKHFGYEFLYTTNNVDVNKPLQKKVPEQCDLLWRRLRERQMDCIPNTPPDQLTVNKYAPGQG